MPKISTKTITYIGLLVAIEIVLNRFLSISAWNIKVGFAFVPVAIGGMFFGPVGGALVGGLGDFIGALLFPIGPYFPGFTLTSALMGACLGYFLHNRQTSARIGMAVLINQLVCGLIINSFWISVLYGSPYMGLIATRIIQCAVLIPTQFIVIQGISIAFSKIVVNKI